MKCRAWVGVLVVVLFSWSCRASEFPTTPEEISASRTKGNAELTAKLQTMQRKTTAVVLHADGTSEPINLADAAAPSKVRDFDTIKLEPGLYVGLGGVVARSIRFVGAGRDQTYIIGKNQPPMPVDASEFWDLTITDARFVARQTEAIWGVNTDLYGDIQLASALGDNRLGVGAAMVLGQVSYANITGGPQYFALSHHAANPLNSAIMDWEPKPTTFKFMDDAIMELSNVYDYGRDGFAGRDDGGPKHQFLPTEKFYAKAVPQIPVTLQTIDAMVLDPNSTIKSAERIMYRRMLARFGNYVAVTERSQASYDTAKFDKLMAQAAAAKKAGHDMAALAMWGQANVVSQFSHNDEIVRLAQPVANGIRDGSACSFATEGENAMWAGVYTNILVAELTQRIPAIALGGGSDCRVVLTATGGITSSDGPKTVIGQRDVYQETGASQARRFEEQEKQREAERQADRAAAREQQARQDATIEGWKNTAQKMEAGRVRTENGKLVYGSGDWTGRASAGTNMEIAKAQSAQSAAASAANQPGSTNVEMEKAGTEVTTASDKTTYRTFKALATVEIKGKKLVVEGPADTVTSVRHCTETRSANGVFSLGADCNDTSSGEDQAPKTAREVLLPKVQDFILSTLYAPHLKKAKKTKSKDPVARFDGLLYTAMFQLGDASALPDAIKDVLGEVTPTPVVTEHALSF